MKQVNTLPKLVKLPVNEPVVHIVHQRSRTNTWAEELPQHPWDKQGVIQSNVCHGQLSKSNAFVSRGHSGNRRITDATTQWTDHLFEAEAKVESFVPQNGVPVLQVS